MTRSLRGSVSVGAAILAALTLAACTTIEPTGDGATSPRASVQGPSTQAPVLTCHNWSASSRPQTAGVRGRLLRVEESLTSMRSPLDPRG